MSGDENPLILRPGMHDRTSLPASFVDRPTDARRLWRRLVRHLRNA